MMTPEFRWRDAGASGERRPFCKDRSATAGEIPTDNPLFVNRLHHGSEGVLTRKSRKLIRGNRETVGIGLHECQ
jgi:hypothetical protein